MSGSLDGMLYGQNMETVGGRKLSRCRVASSPMARYHFVRIEGSLTADR
jgi:hypothetical protein